MNRIRTSLSSLSAYDLHKRLINEYILCRQGATSLLQRDTSRDKHDIDVIRENHRFLWNAEDAPDSWEERLAKKYYDKLFKEYCICDLSRYKENKVALRWRTEQEVIIGKGQFTCGTKQCNDSESLRTWEVNFAYGEQGVKKNALVKLRLCSECSDKLNYHHKKREIIHAKRRNKYNRDEKDVKKRRKGNLECSNELSQDVQVPECTRNDQKVSTDDDIEANLWREAGKKPDEKSREEEFQDYLEELLL